MFERRLFFSSFSGLFKKIEALISGKDVLSG